MPCVSIKDKPLHRLGVIEIVEGVGQGLFTAEDVVRSCLQRITEREQSIAAWAHIDAENALIEAAGMQPHGPLSGVPFGVKDVLDTGALPTEMGSEIYRGHRPRYDAGCVAQARMAGAIILGKTVSAEFAGTQPTRTNNPHELSHTPGGSSSGSAAAVADFMVPFAFGTQTGGSVLRPAAFCGAVGFKPTYGFYSAAGMKLAAQSFDTVGLIARSVPDIAHLHGVLMNGGPCSERPTPPRVGLFRTHLWDTVDSDAQRAVELAMGRISKAGAQVVEVELPDGFATITHQRAVINAFERARGLAAEWAVDSQKMSAQSAEVCERGFAISGVEYITARREVELFRATAGALFEDADILLTPVTPGEAPKGKFYAGDPRLQELWTMLHMPSITLPVASGSNGLPVGVQLVGARFEDHRLLDSAKWISTHLNGA